MAGAVIPRRNGGSASRSRAIYQPLRRTTSKVSSRSSPTNMSTEVSSLLMGTIEVLVVRKPIKNLHLSILPPDGKVRVSSPLRLKDDAIRTLIATRIPWIRKHQASFHAQERQSPREYVSGESQYLFGRRYRLEVEGGNGVSHVYIRNKSRIVLEVRATSSSGRREQVFREWYRAKLKPVVSELVEKWSEKISVRPRAWGIKRMKTRWGTCNQKAGRICLNLELAKKPVRCIEY